MVRAVSDAITEGIRIKVKCSYLEGQSVPSAGRFAFAYTVMISNEGEQPAQLISRHWVITDADDVIREVRGEGVVGEQPKLEPGETFEYTSGCVLSTAWGTMHGTYRFTRTDGEDFDAEIAPFLLASKSVETAYAAN